MRTILLNENFYHKKVAYTLISYEKIGIVVSATMENSKSQFYYPGNWRRFKRYIA